MPDFNHRLPVMTSHPRYYWRIAGFYFFYFAFVGMFSPYWSLYLKSLSFDVVQIGVLMSIQPVMRMVAPALWGWLADYLEDRRLVIQMAALGCVVAYTGVFFVSGYAWLFLVMALMSFFWSASMPLVEATTLTYLGKHASRYGRLRSWGSIGFIVTVLGLGYLFDYIDIYWILWAGMIIMLGILIFAGQIPATEVVSHHTDSQPIRQIVLQPQVMILFISCFLMAVAHGPYYTFFSIYLVEHGYAKSAVGMLWSLGVICEIGVFFLMPWLMQRFSLVQILTSSLAMAVLRFQLIAWQVDTLGLLLLAQILHAATFGSFHASSVALVHQFFRGRHQSKGQALFGSVTYGMGGMAGGLLSGPIWSVWGGSVMYTFSSISALAGFILMYWNFRNIESS